MSGPSTQRARLHPDGSLATGHVPALPPATARVLGIVTVGLVCAWLLLTLYVIQSVMPHTVVSLPPRSSDQIGFVLPQGWSFFTRNPRESGEEIYRANAHGQWVPTSRAPNFQPSTLFGASRLQRAEGIDLGVLYGLVPAKAWTACHGPSSPCLSRFQDPIPIDIPRRGFLLCGSVGLVSREPVPWAWSRDRSRVVMPAKVVRLSVRC